MPVSHDKTEGYPPLPEVVHELRNRLGVIRNAVYFLEHQAEPTPETAKYFQLLRLQIQQSEKLIADLLEAGRAPTRRAD